MTMWTVIALLFELAMAAVLMIMLEFLEIDSRDFSTIGFLICLICIWRILTAPNNNWIALHLFWSGVFLVLIGVIKGRRK